MLSSSTVGRDTVSLSFTAFEDTVIDHYTNGVGAQHEIPRQQGMDASKKDAGAKCRPEAFVQPLATNEGVEARHTAFSVAPGTTPLHFSQLPAAYFRPEAADWLRDGLQFIMPYLKFRKERGFIMPVPLCAKFQCSEQVLYVYYCDNGRIQLQFLPFEFYFFFSKQIENVFPGRLLRLVLFPFLNTNFLGKVNIGENEGQGS